MLHDATSVIIIDTVVRPERASETERERERDRERDRDIDTERERQRMRIRKNDLFRHSAHYKVGSSGSRAGRVITTGQN